MSTQSFAAFCAANDESALLGQWDAKKNAPLTPDDITYCPVSTRRATALSRMMALQSSAPL